MKVDKLFSGRFWFTIVAAWVFASSAWNKILTAEQIVTIIMLIFGFYFNRTDRKGEDKQ